MTDLDHLQLIATDGDLHNSDRQPHALPPLYARLEAMDWIEKDCATLASGV